MIRQKIISFDWKLKNVVCLFFYTPIVVFSYVKTDVYSVCVFFNSPRDETYEFKGQKGYVVCEKVISSISICHFRIACRTLLWPFSSCLSRLESILRFCWKNRQGYHTVMPYARTVTIYVLIIRKIVEAWAVSASERSAMHAALRRFIFVLIQTQG